MPAHRCQYFLMLKVLAFKRVGFAPNYTRVATIRVRIGIIRVVGHLVELAALIAATSDDFDAFIQA